MNQSLGIRVFRWSSRAFASIVLSSSNAPTAGGSLLCLPNVIDLIFRLHIQTKLCIVLTTDHKWTFTILHIFPKLIMEHTKVVDILVFQKSKLSKTS